MIDPDLLSAEKRAQILQGAAIVFDRDGYEGASMSRIAREANVSKGTLYNHFASKADLFAAHVAQACATYLEPAFGGIDPAATLEATLMGVARRIMAMVLSPHTRDIYRMVISEAASFPELAAAFFDAGPRNATSAMARWIAAEHERGRLTVADPVFAAEQFFSLCQAHLVTPYRLHLIESPAPGEIDRIAAGAVATFLARYKAP